MPKNSYDNSIHPSNNLNMNDNINRQVCAYALGKASELYPTAFGPFAFSVLQVSSFEDRKSIKYAFITFERLKLQQVQLITVV
jgi:hypothetical protein